MERPEGGRLQRWRLTCIEDEFTSSENTMWIQACEILQRMAINRGLEMEESPTVCQSCDGEFCSRAFVFVDCRNTRLQIPMDLNRWKSSLCKKPTQRYFNLDKDFPDLNTLTFFLYDICNVLGFLYPDIFYVHCEWTYRQWTQTDQLSTSDTSDGQKRRPSGSCPRGLDGITTWNHIKTGTCLSDCSGSKLKYTGFEQPVRIIQKFAAPLVSDDSSKGDSSEEAPSGVITNVETGNGDDAVVARWIDAVHIC